MAGEDNANAAAGQAEDKAVAPEVAIDQEIQKSQAEFAPNVQAKAVAAAPADAPVPETPAEDKPAEPQYFDVGDEEVTLDVLKEAYKNAEDTQAKIKQVNDIVDQIKERPADTMLQILTAQHGGDRNKGFAALVSLAEQIITFHLKREEMTPEARRLAELEEENGRYKTEREERERAAKEAEEAEAVEKATVALKEGMDQAVKQLSLTDSPRLRQKTAAVLKSKYDAGLKTFSTVEAMKIASALLKKERLAAIEDLSPDELPPEKLEKIRQHNIASTKSNLNTLKTGDGPERQSGKVQLPRRVGSLR